MMKKTVVLSIFVVAVACSTAPKTVPTPQRNGQGPSGDSTRAAGDSGRAGGNAAAQPRPYNRVITRDAKTRRAIFAVHRVNENMHFNIPRHELNTHILLVRAFPSP